MGSYNRDNKRSSGGGFKRSFGGGQRPNRSMHKATCGDCGDDCEIPFKPTGGRPVYCSNCFEKQDSKGGKPSRFSSDRGGRGNFDNKQMHDVICSKCHKECQVPFRPTSSKPVFCNDCFGKSGDSSRGSSDSSKQIQLLTTKIDRILEILDPQSKEKSKKESEFKKDVKAEVNKESKKGSKKIVKAKKIIKEEKPKDTKTTKVKTKAKKVVKKVAKKVVKKKVVKKSKK